MVPPSSTQRGPVLSSQEMVPAGPLFLIVVVIGSIAVVYLNSVGCNLAVLLELL